MRSNEKSNDDNAKAEYGFEGRVDAKEYAGEEDVEYNCQAPGDIVKWNLDIFKAKIVECDHPHYPKISDVW